MSTRASGAVRWANLLVPGGGLILLGNLWTGVLIALLFTLLLNFALLTALLTPDSFPPWVGQTSVGFAIGTYLAAQWRLRQVVRWQAHHSAAERRRQVLRDAQCCFDGGQPEEAVRVLDELADQAEHDLLLAYRLAEARTACGDDDARAAWQRVRALDRHHVYGDAIATAERKLANAAGGPDAARPTAGGA